MSFLSRYVLFPPVAILMWVVFAAFVVEAFVEKAFMKMGLTYKS